MKIAPPVQLRTAIVKALEDKAEEYVRTALFQKLFDILDEKPPKNAGAELKNEEDKASNNLIVKAIREGMIYYDGRSFKAYKKFGVRLAKEFQKLGAVLRNGGYHLPRRLGDPTFELIWAEVAAQRTRAANKLAMLNAALLAQTEAPSLDIRTEVENLVDSISTSVNSSLGISYEMDAYTRNRLVDEYVMDMEKYSKKLIRQANIELKTFVAAEVATVNLTEKALGQLISDRYGIAARHARFIAHQESTMARERINRVGAEKVGFRHYVWQTVGDYRVRPEGGKKSYMGDNHRRLDGKVFSFDDPPIVDRIKGRKCNPGEDFGCRCTARVIIDDEHYEI